MRIENVASAMTTRPCLGELGPATNERAGPKKRPGLKQSTYLTACIFIITVNNYLNYNCCIYHILKVKMMNSSPAGVTVPIVLCPLLFTRGRRSTALNVISPHKLSLRTTLCASYNLVAHFQTSCLTCRNRWRARLCCHPMKW